MDARSRLLSRLLEAYGDEFPAPSQSMRDIAARVGTSHGLLAYHFGSYAGVLAALLAAQRQRDNQLLAREAATSTSSELLKTVWEHYADARRVGRVRAFFYVAGLAAYEAETFAAFLATLDDLTELFSTTLVREGWVPWEAKARATVVIAAARGLLLQQLLRPYPDPEALLSELTRLVTR